ncbi:TPA: tetratricopeptide repeat protein [Aeromonas hydrophila]
MKKPPLSSHLAYLKKFLFICLVCTFCPVSHASTKNLSITDSTTSQLIGVMYTSQQMQLETVKEQQRLELEKLHSKLSVMGTRIDNFQSDLDSQKQVIESERQETASISKRIDDSLVYSGQSLDRFGIGITIGLALFGLVSYFSFAEKTKHESRSVAEQWFNNNARELHDTIKRLDEEATIARNKMSEHVDAVGKNAEEASAVMQRATALVSPRMPEPNLDSSPTAQQRVVTLKDTLNSNYKYDDWNTLAYDSYLNQNIEEASFYWLRASEAIGASDIEKSIALYNRGIAQSQLNQLESAIVTYDEIISHFDGSVIDLPMKELLAKTFISKGILLEKLNKPDLSVGVFDEVIGRFGNAVEPELKIQVASAQVNKGVMYERLNKIDTAIVAYNDVISRLNSSSEPILKEMVAVALINKGHLQQRNKKDGAASAYHEVIHRFGEETTEGIKKQVAYAYNGIGFELLCCSKVDLANNNKIEAERKLNQALEHFDRALTYLNQNEINGLIVGNRAYSLALLGELEQAEYVFSVALEAPVYGGNFLYEATLTDFDINPIPQDQPIRALVERQWKIWLAEHGS